MWLQQYAPGGNSLHRALELDPNNSLAAYNAGICAFRMEQYEMAITYLDRAMKLAPNDSDMLLALANAYTQKGDYNESIALLETVNNEDKNYPKAIFNQAVNHYRKDDKMRACELWESSKALGHLNAEDSIKQYCDQK
jgi:tetratricopeptide (TPR) repeat protein